MSSGNLSQDWVTATVVSIHKSDKWLASNYRPTSLRQTDVYNFISCGKNCLLSIGGHPYQA